MTRLLKSWWHALAAPSKQSLLRLVNAQPMREARWSAYQRGYRTVQRQHDAIVGARR